MSNPLLNLDGLPPFSTVSNEQIKPAIERLIEHYQTGIETATSRHPVSWENFCRPLDELADQLNRAWSVVSHLNAVMNNDALRQVHDECLSLLTDFHTEMGQNDALYQGWKALKQDDYANLSRAQQKTIDNALRDFRLSGIGLSPRKKARFKTISNRLSELGSQFSNHVLDATKGWSRPVTDLKELAGLPDDAIALAKQIAERENQSGWLLTLELPSYQPAMMYAQNRQLRKELYHAYVTRASETGPNSDKWDNTEIINETLALRHEMAKLLGFANYAELSLETKMATSTGETIHFLYDLAEKSLPQAMEEHETLCEFALKTDGIEKLEAWDTSYYSEKLREKTFSISQETLKPYFPVDKVLNGLFKLLNTLYGINIINDKSVDVWHPNASYYQLLNQQGEQIAGFYLDLYARPDKRGGAWMDVCTQRMKKGEEMQLPIAYLVCNFTPPIDPAPALLTHNEVLTLFHEFGHGLHHMLTQVDYQAVSGISGVAWDAVELPSQFMENWCWQPEVIQWISGHYETGETIPTELMEKLDNSRHFQSAMQMLRQLEFALFDFRIHLEYSENESDPVYPILDQLRMQVAISKPPEFNRFPNSFSHIFAGGYAAGYYSYKWAEVLSADAFSLFETEGLFNLDCANRFRQSILEQGGSKDAMDLFTEFRGRRPETSALLEHSGIKRYF